MNRLATAAWLLAISALLASTALAAEGSRSRAVRPDFKRGSESEATAKSKVPQAQMEAYKKREKAKKRRDELMKMRAAAIQTGGSGRR